MQAAAKQPSFVRNASLPASAVVNSIQATLSTNEGRKTAPIPATQAVVEEPAGEEPGVESGAEQENEDDNEESGMLQRLHVTKAGWF